ncbi:DUF1259 domain-containing protein [Limobrevibacterium gyesilva]|uniref:DUF1259 domain-containing protein n=1 Tax=Limobrevibacterium gyesilva TaxID=2991712 RepID=A0AA41YWV2_9PROT|nr:DUF1259 domain-containing protein [Limobrevibacterium gyesilva]MCW3477850.1 DUF1259 domain-containing protein [Limobrevibacterium gyesilva]
MRSTFAVAIAGSLLAMSPAISAEIDWSKVDQALGKQGADQPGAVRKYGLPRTDLQVTLDGVPIKPTFALGGWLAFKSMGNQAMVMGDLVLTEQEINPVMTRLLADGVTVTAVHNHLLRAQPATFYMHVAGRGDPVELAGSLHEALSASKTPFGAPAATAQPAAQMDLDTAKLEQTLGHKGTVNGGILQFGIPRNDAVEDGGMTVPPSMGTAIAINFEPIGNGQAGVTGDFVLLASEVNPVLQALRQNGIEVTALHNHMLDERPRMFFVHFWAHDDAMKLALGLHAALERVNVAKS